MEINKIFDLQKRSYNFALEIVKILKSLPRNFIAETIGKQLLRSATSVGANIIEGRSSASKRDFANFYRHSLKSANETKFWISLLQDAKMVTDINSLRLLLRETEELASILASCLLKVRPLINF